MMRKSLLAAVAVATLVAVAAIGSSTLTAPAPVAALPHSRSAVGRAERLTAPQRGLRAASAGFRILSVPGGAGSLLNCVNNQGTLLGTSLASRGASHGFIDQPGRQPTAFNYPGTKGVTSPGCVNDVGTAVGWYFDSHKHVVHGWVRSERGRFTQIDDPSAVLATNPNGISDDGLIVGASSPDAGSVRAGAHHR
jgi:hypothetical protein